MTTHAAAASSGIRVHYRAGWLSWVSSVNACLEGLGLMCKACDVAGMSGYAFHIAIHRDLNPSGPTVFPRADLEDGIWYLGRATLSFGRGECHTPGQANARTAAHARTAFELARREVEAGRPCIMWGAYLPEFAVVTGIEGDCYQVSSFRECLDQPQPPIPAEAVNAPGGPYTLTFPMPVELDRAEGDRRALDRAITFARRPARSTDYAFGPSAYALWIDALQSGRADPMGNAYCAAAYAEARHEAQHFLETLARRHRRAEQFLMEASLACATVADALERISALFPFPVGPYAPEAGDPALDDTSIPEACDDLAIAGDADAEMVALLEKARAVM